MFERLSNASAPLAQSQRALCEEARRLAADADSGAHFPALLAAVVVAAHPEANVLAMTEKYRNASYLPTEAFHEGVYWDIEAPPPQVPDEFEALRDVWTQQATQPAVAAIVAFADAVEASGRGVVARNASRFPVLWFPTATTTREMVELASGATRRMLGTCEAGIRQQTGEELLGEGDCWRVFAAWVIWVAQEGCADPMTGLRLDLSGATTLAAKRRHDKPFLLPKNCAAEAAQPSRQTSIS